ncbi:hypothetical protein F4779DRAFT_633938 [Xylariaceae sp. FL0662B]|nr:hypothetical protein F4779DRAFT_633938 [Xylariaceae sp. FL0662B]
MSHNILITGGSGYLGGTLLARLGNADLPPCGKLYALVRTDSQANAVKEYGAEPVRFNPKDELAVRSSIIEKDITVVYFLIDPLGSESQVYIIEALAEVKTRTGRDVHFLHTSGAKLFSSHTGAPTDRPILDTDPELFSIQKSQKSAFETMQTALDTNCTIIEKAEEHGVRSYVFVPCIVYGKGEGFGNAISIQTVAIVKAARALKRVYKVDSDRPTWPVCHVIDNTTMYIELLRKILAGGNPGHGKNGYYLASSGSVAWDDLYVAMAGALAKRNVVVDDSLALANEQNRADMGKALGCPGEFVGVMLGGKCTLTARHGKEELGWKPIYSPEHILEAADAEVELILQNLKD